MRAITLLLGATALLATACGSGSSDSDVAPSGDSATADVGFEESIEDPDGFAEGVAEDLVDLQDSKGGGSATFLVGDQEWTFSSILCAFGPEEIGQDGAEFVLSSIQEGLQMYVSIDSFGDSISLNDINDFENPSVDLGSFGSASITVNGKNVSATADFIDGTTDDFTTIPGTFEATCP